MECLNCHKKFKNLNSLSKHLVPRLFKVESSRCCSSIQEYYDKYLLKDIKEKYCLICGKETKFNGLKGYSKYCSSACVSKSDIEKQKIKKTNIEKYGCESHNQYSDIKQKKIQTCLKRYGVSNPYQSKEVQNKYKKTCYKKYGFNNPFCVDIVKIKIKNSLIKKYNVEHPYQSLKIQQLGKDTCLLKFGVDNYSKTFEFRLKARNRLIERIQRIYGSINPRIGNNEKEFFDELQKQTPYKFILNEYFYGYYPDARIEEKKIIIEFDEPEHRSRTWYIRRDQQKDEDYKILGYKIIRVLEEDWLKNKQNTVLECLKSIGELNGNRIE